MMATFSDILDDDRLRGLAGDRYFERGVGYFEQGRVRSLAEYDDCITAEVQGTESYQVQLWLQGDRLMSRCTCPLGVDDLFCKHCVAVGLAWIDEPPPHRPDGKPSAKAGTTMRDVHDYLARQQPETLVQMILERAMEDARWREQLLMKTAADQATGADIGTFRRALKNAIAVDDYVDYYAADSYIDGVETVVDGLEDLLEAGYASDVITLSEEAITLLEGAFDAVDDSSGYLSLVANQVQALHYRACETARPDPRALAERLFHLELNSGFGFFHSALETYANLLGDEGLESYQQLVDTAWKTLAETDLEEHSRFNYRRSQLRRMQEALVAKTGSLEDLVATIAEDLSRPSRYLQIAQLYQEARQTDNAIAWAERGLEAFRDHYRTGQLGDFLITAYEQQSRFDDAIAVVWQDFARQPSLPLYQRLKQQAEKAHDWPEWRAQALSHVRQWVDRSQQAATSPYARLDHSLLVEIFLSEGETEPAWQAAQTGGCHPRLWMQLADIRADDHPEESLAVYQPAIEPLINQTKNDAYREAVDLLIKVEDLMVALDRVDEFDQFVDNLSTTYKRKRNFIKYLQQAELIA
ncbi:MAG: hypothetical protein F6J97_22985 [Leptolyngbya sp. SIO4C1]|nr:hypothetical protein [Leptolyngbya sp. SIO4C1]